MSTEKKESAALSLHEKFNLPDLDPSVSDLYNLHYSIDYGESVNFPETFKRAVLAAYPEKADLLKQALDANDQSTLHSALMGRRDISFRADFIVECLEQGNGDQLLALARSAQNKRALWRQYRQLTIPEFGESGPPYML